MGRKSISLSPNEKINCLTAKIEREISHWKDMLKNGCSDPGWSDGANMNLTRNHVIYYKHEIKDLCDENDIEYPEVLRVPTPPEVPNTYMADLRCKRAEKLRKWGDNLTHKKVNYDDEQLVIF